MNRFLFLSALLIFTAIPTLSAHASDPKAIGTFGKWSAYTFVEDGKKVCYMAAKPTKEEGKYKKRDDVYALITHRPEEGSKNVFSYITGYTYKPTSDAIATIGKSSFALFTQNNTAWAPDAQTDNKLAKAIQSGSKMIVTGTSSRGTKTTDTFSLSGTGAAYKAISKACGL